MPFRAQMNVLSLNPVYIQLILSYIIYFIFSIVLFITHYFPTTFIRTNKYSLNVYIPLTQNTFPHAFPFRTACRYVFAFSLNTLSIILNRICVPVVGAFVHSLISTILKTTVYTRYLYAMRVCTSNQLFRIALVCRDRSASNIVPVFVLFVYTCLSNS